MRSHPLFSVLLGLLGELVAPTGCTACDARVPPAALFCGACAPTVEAAAQGERAVFAYGGAIAEAIVRFKFRGRSDLATRFARVMLTRTPPAEVVVPVPLHPRRLAERGYNQAALLAGPIAQGIGARFAPRALRRVRDTPMQSALDRSARLANLEQAFVVRSPRSVEGRSVLLIDDVRTTGTTLEACTGALHEAGAARVFSLVLAWREGGGYHRSRAR